MINVTVLILKLSISHFYMVMFLSLHHMESISLNSLVFLEHLGTDFNTGNELLTQKLLKQGYQYHLLRKIFSKFCQRNTIYNLISKFQVGLKSLLCQGLLEPEFYGDLVYRLMAIIFFSAQFIKIISHYERLAITLMYCNRLHAWWPTQSRLTTLLSSLIACQWVRLQTLWRFQLKDLSFDEMVGAWCFGYCQAHQGLPVGFLLLGYSVYVLFALSPFYILIYMFYEMMLG